MTVIDKPICSFNPALQPKAAELFHAAHSGQYWLIICGGAVRGGKSFGVGGTIITLQKRYPGTRAFVVRDSLQTLRTTTLPTMEKLIPPRFVKQFKGDPQFLWKFTNGSSFQFFSEQDHTDPERKRWNGLEANYIWLEQGEELQESTFEKAIERRGSYFVPSHIGITPPSIIFVTVNPTDVKWVRKYFDSWKAGTLATDYPGVCYIPMTIDDNGNADPAYKEGLQMLKATNPVKYKIYVEGDWDVKEKTGGEWYHQFDYGKHTGSVPFLPNLTGDVHGTFDFNTVPYMTMLGFQIQWVNNRLQVRWFREYCLANPSNTTNALCEAVERDYLRPHRRSFTYHGDRQGENRVEGEGNFRRFDRVRTALARYLHSRSNGVNKAVVVSATTRDYVNDVLAGRLPIDILIDEEQCPNLIRDLAQTKEGVGGIKKEIATDKNKVRYEKNGHCLSAFTYGLVSVTFELFQQWKKQQGRLVDEPV